MSTHDITKEAAIPEKTVTVRLVQDPHLAHGADQINKMLLAVSRILQPFEEIGIITAFAQISESEWRIQLAQWGTESRIYDLRHMSLFTRADDLEQQTQLAS